MRLMFPEKIRVATFVSIAVVLVFFVGGVDAQRRSAPKKAIQAKKTEKQVRDTKKENKSQAKKDAKKDDKHSKDRVRPG